MLIQIHEPGQSPLPHDDENDIAIGIDLGTTNSLVAIANNGKPEVITDKNGNALHPSIVAYLENGAVTTGHTAREHHTHISSIKRLMGRSSKDAKDYSLPYKIVSEDGIIRLDINGKELTPVEISAEILKSLKHTAEQALGHDVNKAVITVPAYFDDSARAATKDAARLAGLEVLRVPGQVVDQLVQPFGGQLLDQGLVGRRVHARPPRGEGVPGVQERGRAEAQEHRQPVPDRQVQHRDEEGQRHEGHASTPRPRICSRSCSARIGLVR